MKGTNNSNTKNLMQNIPSVINDDYIQCSHCDRRYNENAYNKHLPTCERRTKEAVMKNKLKGTSSKSNFNTNKKYY
jgi:hypothetical protein